VANACVAGPAATGNIQDGGHAIQRADGKFLIFLGRNSTATSLYDPVANTMAADPPRSTRSTTAHTRRSARTVVIW
jgi:hypothetical protein